MRATIAPVRVHSEPKSGRLHTAARLDGHQTILTELAQQPRNALLAGKFFNGTPVKFIQRFLGTKGDAVEWFEGTAWAVCRIFVMWNTWRRMDRQHSAAHAWLSDGNGRHCWLLACECAKGT